METANEEEIAFFDHFESNPRMAAAVGEAHDGAMENDVNSYRVISIPTNTVEKVLATRRAPGYGHPTYTEVAAGHGPCRHCLQAFRIGEEQRTLFTYDPFWELKELPLPGPVFVHEDRCARYDESAGFPKHLTAHGLTLVGYGEERQYLKEQKVAAHGNAERFVLEMLQEPSIQYIHVRDTEAGCYDFRIERA